MMTGQYKSPDVEYLTTQFTLMAELRNDLLSQIDPILLNISGKSAAVGGYGGITSFPAFAYPERSHPQFAYPDQPNVYSYYPDAPPIPPPPPVAGPVPAGASIAMHDFSRTTGTYFHPYVIIIIVQTNSLWGVLHYIRLTCMEANGVCVVNPLQRVRVHSRATNSQKGIFPDPILVNITTVFA